MRNNKHDQQQQQQLLYQRYAASGISNSNAITETTSKTSTRSKVTTTTTTTTTSASVPDLTSVLDQLIVMRKQEETIYLYRNHLPKYLRNNNGGTDGNFQDNIHVNLTWREKICQWSYNVVDHFELSREVVAVSLDLFDRYLATCGNRVSGSQALLTSLTTLHIAMKLHDPKKIKISVLVDLSRGQFDQQDIVQMEQLVLSKLEWRVSPPTQLAFVSNLLRLLPQETNKEVRKDIFDLTRYLTELAVCDSYFVGVNSSTVAFASILNVLEDLNYERLPVGTRERFLCELSTLGLYYYTPSVVAARDRLRDMLAASNALDSLHYASFATQESMTSSPSGAMDHDCNSVSGNSFCSISSNGSYNSSNSYNKNTSTYATKKAHSRSNSIESIGSYRYPTTTANGSSSTRMRCSIVANVSPMTSSRVHRSSSPMVAGIQ